MNQELADLVEKKQKSSGAANRIDWDERRDKFVAAVNGLYDQIAVMLADAVNQKKVELQVREKQLTESYIGTYGVGDLILVIGNEQVRFSPRGRNIVGAEGRVDVVGERGEAVLALQANSSWGFLQSRQPKPKVAPFTAATLAEVLQDVMRE